MRRLPTQARAAIVSFASWRPTALALGVAVAASGLGPVGCGLNRQGALETTASAGAPAGGMTATSSSTTTTNLFGGAGGGTTTTGPSGGGGQGSGEDCTNGEDDDGDQKVDCADDDCLGPYQCVPLGDAPGRLVTSPSNGCTAGLETVSYSSCATCSCAADPASCVMTVTLHDEAGCAGKTNDYGPDHDGGCRDVNPDFAAAQSNSVSATAKNGVVGSPTCTASGGGLDPAPTSWCAAPAGGAGCGADAVCLPVVPAPWCVAVTLPEACPSNTTPTAWLFDHVGEATCECGCEPNATCPTTQLARLSEQNNCASAIETVDATGACVDSGVDTIKGIFFEEGSADVSCAPTETVAGADRVVVCCLP